MGKSAGPDVHAEAKEVVGPRVLACVAALNREGAALGLEITAVDLRHVPTVGKAAAPAVVKVADPEPRWPADLTDPRWRP